jgi:cytochrome c-type biogenesis protein CcmH
MTPLAGLRRAAFALAALVMLSGAAADPAERLHDPAQEARARALFRDVRCLVCQSQSIDESDAELAHDLRQLVREQIAEGKTDAQIRGYLVSRYGQFVLLTPRPSLGNAVLWIGPLLVVILGAAALVGRRRPQPTDAGELTTQEEKALAKLSRDETV